MSRLGFSRRIRHGLRFSEISQLKAPLRLVREHLLRTSVRAFMAWLRRITSDRLPAIKPYHVERLVPGS